MSVDNITGNVWNFLISSSSSYSIVLSHISVCLIYIMIAPDFNLYILVISIYNNILHRKRLVNLNKIKRAVLYYMLCAGADYILYMFVGDVYTGCYYQFSHTLTCHVNCGSVNNNITMCNVLLRSVSLAVIT